VSTGWVLWVLPADRDAGSRDAFCPSSGGVVQGALGWEGEGKGQMPLAANRRANSSSIANTEKRDRFALHARAYARSCTEDGKQSEKGV
jgi:hypothetical protein